MGRKLLYGSHTRKWLCKGVKPTHEVMLVVDNGTIQTPPNPWVIGLAEADKLTGSLVIKLWRPAK